MVHTAAKEQQLLLLLFLLFLFKQPACFLELFQVGWCSNLLRRAFKDC